MVKDAFVARFVHAVQIGSGFPCVHVCTCARLSGDFGNEWLQLVVGTSKKGDRRPSKSMEEEIVFESGGSFVQLH